MPADISSKPVYQMELHQDVLDWVRTGFKFSQYVHAIPSTPVFDHPLSEHPLSDLFSKRYCQNFGGSSDLRSSVLFAAGQLMEIRVFNTVSLIPINPYLVFGRNVAAVDCSFRGLSKIIESHRRFLEDRGLNPRDVVLVTSTTRGIPEDQLLGVPVVFEDRPFLRNPIRATPPSTRTPIWPSNYMLLAYRPGDGMNSRDATISILSKINLFVETWCDGNGNRGRVIDEYSLSLNPEFGMLISIED